MHRPDMELGVKNPGYEPCCRLLCSRVERNSGSVDSDGSLGAGVGGGYAFGKLRVPLVYSFCDGGDWRKGGGG